MKKLRTRLVSAFLVIMTLLTLLPTSALAASSTGTGIKPTSNTNYWTTRLLHDGTPYSYKPPMAAGKMLYCLDRGYGYRWGTPSFLNSYTYTSATGADADAVLKTALAQSGMGELDAQQLENFKWMMSFIVDYKGDIPGSLFMAAQTYVWDHQTFKGEGDGDIDGGGYANADTYEMYLGYIDWMLKEKAKEDAEFQRQIEEYAEQGIIATVVEDEAAKWAVYAKSSVKGRQAFFNYYAPRKLVTNTSEPGKPPAGDADITLRKVAAGTTRGLDGAKFNIYRDGQIVGSDVTQNGGIIEVKDVTKGLWSFVETEAPEGYCADSTPISVYVDTTDGDKQYTVTAENYALPDMKITKRDAMSGKPIAGTVFSVKSVTGSYSTSVTTGTDGSATLSAIPAGVYVVREESVPEPYIVSNTEQTVALRPGKTSAVTFVDYEKPGLEIIKKNIANGEPIEGVTYRIEQIDGSFSTSATTDNHGRIFLESIPVGSYKVTEINVPNHVILCPIPQEVALKPGETSTVTFFNALKPSLEIRKVDSVTGDPVKGAKFQIWYGSNHTDTGELNDLGTYFSDASGKIILPEIKDGWYKVTELEPASGYAIKEPATQECFIAGGESKVLIFENTPLSAIIIRKVDSESGQPLEGAWFRVRYLGGTSGTGGTVIGEYRTSSNGTIVVTGLKAGTYVCEEISAPDGYVITDATETVYISGKDQDVITVTFGNDKMGSLLIVKKDAVTGAPISDVEFLVTDSDGSVIGNANGKYVTDSAGTIRIDGLTPGMTVIAKEVRAKDGYILDETPQTVKVKSGEVVTVEFRNQPKGNLIVVKQDSVTKEPLEGVQFKIVYADGSYVDAEGGTLSSTGLYWTDKEGKITLSGISGTVVVTEVETIPGYTIDENTRTQTVVINPNDTQTLHFYNDPVGGVEIIKVNEDNHSERIPNTTFEIRKVDDALVDTVTTDKNGRVFVSLEDGSYYAKEVTSNKSFRLDDTPHYFEIKDGKRVTLQVTNKKLSGIVIHKIDSATGEGIYGVKFVLYDANKKPIGEYTSDDEGYIYIDEIPGGLSGRFYLRELEAAPGYTLDKQYKTVYVSPGKTVEIEWENTAVTGQIQIYKYAAEYNEVTGTAAGTPLKGAVYEIVNARSGKVVDYITTDARGVAASKPLPLTRYQIREVTAPAYWQLDPTVHDVTLEYPGQIIKLSAYDKPASLGVTITKRGNAQVMAGQSMRYDLTVANTSNVPLESFFWHDKIPYDVARPTTLTTGTYSARLNYRILYKTNCNTSYQVLASNLLTSNNYSFSLNAIPMQAGEVVTDIYFDFGKVPVGFQSVVNPTLSVMVNGNAVNGYCMVNRADVGGKYQGTWQTATANWVTIIRRLWNTPTLPKTGY